MTPEKEKQVVVHEVKIAEENIKSIRTLMREANQSVDRAESHLAKAGEKYDNILVILEESGIPWDKITLTIQNVIFPDWPRKSEGSNVPMGYQKAMENGFAPASWFNRFNTYRTSKYVGYKTEKPSTPRVSEMTPEERATFRIEKAKRASDLRITTPHVINKALVRHSLLECMTFASVIHNDEAMKLVKKLWTVLGLDTQGDTCVPLKEPVDIDGTLTVPEDFHKEEPEGEEAANG